MTEIGFAVPFCTVPFLYALEAIASQIQLLTVSICCFKLFSPLKINKQKRDAKRKMQDLKGSRCIQSSNKVMMEEGTHSVGGVGKRQRRSQVGGTQMTDCKITKIFSSLSLFITMFQKLLSLGLCLHEDESRGRVS